MRLTFGQKKKNRYAPSPQIGIFEHDMNHFHHCQFSHSPLWLPIIRPRVFPTISIFSFQYPKRKKGVFLCACVDYKSDRHSIMSPRKHWDTVCQTLAIPIPVATIWFEKLATNYTQSNRYYHNANLLTCKLAYLNDHVMANGCQSIQSHLIFAIFFQYYQFDVKRNCCAENCDAFRGFCRDAALNDVSTDTQYSYVCVCGERRSYI